MASIDMIQTFNPLPSVSDHQQQQQQQQLHVLAVDDSIIDRKVIERLLKISSCKVTAVDSGRRALQLLGLLDGEKNSNSIGIDGLKVNMIITDYWMPGMTGYELMKKIKESSNFKEIPVVIMSSENVLPRINRCLEEGAEEFLVKPVQLSDVKRLKNHLTSSSSTSTSTSTREGNDLVVVVDSDTTTTTNKRKLQVDSSNDDVIEISTTTKTTIESPSRRIRSIDYTDLI